MKIEQKVCGLGASYHESKDFDMGEASERHGGTSSEPHKSVEPKLKDGTGGLQGNIRRMLGM